MGGVHNKMEEILLVCTIFKLLEVTNTIASLVGGEGFEPLITSL